MSSGYIQVYVQEALNAHFDKWRFKKVKKKSLPTVLRCSIISDSCLRIRAFYKYKAKNMDKIMDWDKGEVLSNFTFSRGNHLKF